MRDVVLRTLEGSNLIPIYIESRAPGTPRVVSLPLFETWRAGVRRVRHRVQAGSVALFARQLATMIGAGLPLVRYTTEERLEEIIQIHQDHGCPIFNPHRYTLEEGGMKRTDAVQLAFKREADPKGLLNPGKMIAWEKPDYDWKSDKVYLFPGMQAAQ